MVEDQNPAVRWNGKIDPRCLSPQSVPSGKSCYITIYQYITHLNFAFQMDSGKCFTST
jgi:hypothetical protein